MSIGCCHHWRVGSAVVDGPRRRCRQTARAVGKIGFFSARLCRAAPLMIAAPFSAIMIVGALVLVEVTAGITEASMTPGHLELVGDDRHRVAPHHAGAARVIAGAAVAPRVIEQFVVALDVAAGRRSSRTNCFSGSARTSAGQSASRR
jgi:hypothetical protein